MILALFALSHAADLDDPAAFGLAWTGLSASAYVQGVEIAPARDEAWADAAARLICADAGCDAATTADAALDAWEIFGDEDPVRASLTAAVEAGQLGPDVAARLAELAEDGGRSLDVDGVIAEMWDHRDDGSRDAVERLAHLRTLSPEDPLPALLIAATWPGDGATKILVGGAFTSWTGSVDGGRADCWCEGGYYCCEEELPRGSKKIPSVSCTPWKSIRCTTTPMQAP